MSAEPYLTEHYTARWELPADVAAEARAACICRAGDSHPKWVSVLYERL